MHEVANILRRNQEPFLESVSDALDYACELLAVAKAPRKAKEIRTEIMSGAWTRKILTRQKTPQQELFYAVKHGKTLIGLNGHDLRCGQCKTLKTVSTIDHFDTTTIDLLATCKCGTTLIQRTTKQAQVEWEEGKWINKIT